MRDRLLPALLCLALLTVASRAMAQPALEKVGVVVLSFKNTTGKGTASLRCTVYYPAQKAGSVTPLKPRKGGYPVLVFLHGLGGRASTYARIGNHVAARGYVVVLNDTAQWNSTTQAQDGNALYSALVAENKRVGAFLKDALDMVHSGLAGHSMGGGNTVRVLASNPGYRMGVGFAPWDHSFLNYPQNYAPKVKIPLAIVHGTGDRLVNWQGQGLRFFNLATTFTCLKVMYVMNRDADHNNVAGTRSSSQKDQEVFARSMAVFTGFLDRFLKGDVLGLEQVLGPTARKEKRLHQIFQQVDKTELWQTGVAKLGGKINLQVLAQPGPAVLALAAKGSPVPTPFGTFLLDPSTMFFLNAMPVAKTGLQSTGLGIPPDNRLRGIAVRFQGLGGSVRGLQRLTGGVDIKVQ